MAGTVPTLRGALKGKSPSISAERALWDAGKDVVVGVDEVGRGAWAGPLTVGVAVIPRDRRIYKIRDERAEDALDLCPLVVGRLESIEHTVCHRFGMLTHLPRVVVTVVEAWTDLDALNAHLKTPHMAEYREAAKNYVKDIRIQVLKPV